MNKTVIASFLFLSIISSVLLRSNAKADRTNETKNLQIINNNSPVQLFSKTYAIWIDGTQYTSQPSQEVTEKTLKRLIITGIVFIILLVVVIVLHCNSMLCIPLHTAITILLVIAICAAAVELREYVVQLF